MASHTEVEMTTRWRPTQRAEWVREGDRCVNEAGWTGTVDRVHMDRDVPQVYVRWDDHDFKHSAYPITDLRRESGT